MHLYKLFIGLALLLAGGTAQAQYAYLMDSLLGYKYSDSNLVLGSSTVFIHQEKDSLLDAYVYSIDSSGNRTPFTHTRYHYDGVHRWWLNLTYRSRNAVDTNWKNLNYMDRVFGNDGISVETRYNWNDTDQVWELTGKDSFFYDGNGRLQSVITFNIKSDTLSPITLLSYVYVAGNHLDTLVRYAYFSGQWKQMRRTEFHADGNGFDTLQMAVNYSTVNGNITGRNRWRYILNQAGDQLLQEYSVYNQLNDVWTLNQRWEQELDPDIPIDQVQIQEEIQNVFHFQWAPISGDHYTLQNGQLTKFVRYEYFKHQVNPNALKPLLSKDLGVYPNPCTNMITFPSTDFPFAESVHIYTLQGVKISQHLLDPAGQLALNELREGIYFLQVLDKDGRVLANVKVLKR